MRYSAVRYCRERKTLIKIIAGIRNNMISRYFKQNNGKKKKKRNEEEVNTDNGAK